MNQIERQTHSIARILLPFALGYFFSYILRNLLALIAPGLIEEFHLSDTTIGLMASVYFLTFALFQVPLGVLLDYYGSRRVEGTLLILAAVGCLVFAAATSLTQLIFGRALIGLGVSACLMASYRAFHRWFPQPMQPALTGAIMAAGALGALTATTPVALLLPTLGWRGIHQLLAVAALIIAVVIWLLPRDHHQRGEHTLWSTLLDLRSIFSRRLFWSYALPNGVFLGGFMALQGLWIVPWLTIVDGISKPATADYLFSVALGMFVGFLFLSSLHRLRHPWLSPQLLLPLSYVLFLLCGVMIYLGEPWAILWWSLLAFNWALSNLAYPLLTGQFPLHLAGRINTGLNLITFIGAFGLQWGFGAMAQAFQSLQGEALTAVGKKNTPFGLRSAMLVFLSLQVITLVWFLWERRRRAMQLELEAVVN